MNPTDPNTTPALLRVRYTGGNYIAVNTTDSKQSVSCTMGEEAAARRWMERFTQGVPIADARPATEAETAHLDKSKDRAGVYYFTWDIREEKAPAVPLATEPAEEATEAPAEETAPADPVSNVLHLPALSLAMHPVLDRVMLVPEAVIALGEHAKDKGNTELAEDLDTDWQAWLEEIRENGILEPLRVVLDVDRYVVIEGRHRLQAAQELGFETVPCILVEVDDLLKYAEGTVRGRRHWTKSQRAWFAVLMHPEIATEGRHGGDRKSNRTECGLIGGKNSALNAEFLATRYGVAPRMIELAISLYRSLEKYTHLRAKYEAGLWGGKGLPGLTQGLAAETCTTNPTGPGVTIERHPVSKLSKIWTSERAHTANWAKADDALRQLLAADLRTEAAKLPADYLEWKAEILETVIAEARREPGYVVAPE